MQLLTRRSGEEVVLDDGSVVVVVRAAGNKVRLGVMSPRPVRDQVDASRRLDEEELRELARVE